MQVSNFSHSYCCFFSLDPLIAEIDIRFVLPIEFQESMNWLIRHKHLLECYF